jgi:hypothetical protein
MSRLPEELRLRLLTLDLVGFTMTEPAPTSDQAAESGIGQTAHAKKGMSKAGLSKQGIAKAA